MLLCNQTRPPTALDGARVQLRDLSTCSKARAYSICMSATASVEVGYMRSAPRHGCLNRNPVLGDYVRSERAMTRSLLKSLKGGPLDPQIPLVVYRGSTHADAHDSDNLSGCPSSSSPRRISICPRTLGCATLRCQVLRTRAQTNHAWRG